ncbi:MAG: bifunctional phosphoribosyl-AMP cyclohydrolase/phosphoribosyl-ATP diphosphatase HisIE [Marinifilaceae bacterium]
MKNITLNTQQLQWDNNGLIPAVIQDSRTRVVLMMGYMNSEALDKTLVDGRVCFYSRSRQKLWTKGETSGNFLNVQSIQSDCDNDTLLIKVIPEGPTCHTGTDSCWGEQNKEADFLLYLERFLRRRAADSPEQSYTARLIRKGINKVAQKVGEEAVELVIEAKDNNESLFLNEAADLMYHYLVLLIAKGYSLEEVCDILRSRHKE